MKRFLFIFTYILFTVNISLAVENIDISPIFLDENSIETGNIALVDEIESPIQNEIKDKPKNKILKDLQFHAAYQGSFNFSKSSNRKDWLTTYTPSLYEGWVTGTFNDKRETSFTFSYTPSRDVSGYNRFWEMFSDINVSTNLTKNNRLLIGQSRTPIGVEGGQGQYSLPFVNRSQIARNYGNIRTIGARLKGNYKYADYDLGVYDSGRYFNNMFRGAEFAGWVNVKPLANLDENKYGKLKFGVGLNSGKNKHNYTVVGAYAGYDYKKFSANFEYAHANGYNGLRNRRNDSEGYAATVSYYIHPKVQILGRYDNFIENKSITKTPTQEITAGVNYYIKGDNLKLMFNYIYKKLPSGVSSNGLIVFTQIMI